MKGNSSHCEFRDSDRSRVCLANEYGVISFGERQPDWVVRYVQSQALHHARGTTIPRLERIVESEDQGEESADEK
jgi:hypothetical protein